MRLPVVCGVIERRVLVNYRVEPAALRAILPECFRPQVVNGYGIAGICLIRLGQIRPRGFPRWLGIGSENAAHRIAVQWDEGGETHRGVYVMRRDTNSRLNALAGGRIFPGVHHRAAFRVRESERRLELNIKSNDGDLAVDLVASLTHGWPSTSVFASLADASAFFEAGSLGYSPSGKPGSFQGLELRCGSWHVQPLSIENVHSSLFDDECVFPVGSITLDCGLLMRGIEHEWHGREDLCCRAAPAHYAAAGSTRVKSAAEITST